MIITSHTSLRVKTVIKALQLHEKLKNNNKVVNLEKTNARYLDKEKITEFIEILVCDVSFISLKKVFLDLQENLLHFLKTKRLLFHQ